MSIDGLELIQANLIIPCEFAERITITRKYLRIFTSRNVEERECEEDGRWVVVYDSDVCEDHQHMAILCDEHRHKFMTGPFDKVICNIGDEPVKIDRLNILSISTL